MPEKPYINVWQEMQESERRARRAEYEADELKRSIHMWKAKWNELTLAQREMWKAICKAYKDKRWQAETHDNTQYDGWVTRADIARQLNKLRLFPYHVANLNHLSKHRWIRIEKRARWIERWDGVRQANGYEYVYEPSEAALRVLGASKKPSLAPVFDEPLPSEQPARSGSLVIDPDRFQPARSGSLIDRVMDWILYRIPI